MSSNDDLAKQAAESIYDHDGTRVCPDIIADTYAPAIANGAMYEKLFRSALRHVDRVFQRCGENPNPILPDFCKLGEDKFVAVVRLAEKYAEQEAELERLRRQVEFVKRESLLAIPSPYGSPSEIRCLLCKNTWWHECPPSHSPDCPHAKEST